MKTSAKSLWRRSIRLGKSDIMGQYLLGGGNEPLTLAIVGCGQRGQVRRSCICSVCWC